MESDARELDRRYAEWYVWTRQNLRADARTCLAAAQAALDALAKGASTETAVAAARDSVGRPSHIFLVAVPEHRRRYAELCERTLGETGGGPPDRLHTAVRAAIAEPVSTAVPVTSPFQAETARALIELVPAGFDRRLAAALVDTILLAIALLVQSVVTLLVVVLMVAIATGSDPNTDELGSVILIAIAVVQLIVSWLYSAVLDSSAWQGTVGKRVVGIKVTDTHGNPVSFARASARFAAKGSVFPTLYMGFLMIAAMRQRQALHDVLAGTLVIRRHYREAASAAFGSIVAGDRQQWPIEDATRPLQPPPITGRQPPPGEAVVIRPPPARPPTLGSVPVARMPAAHAVKPKRNIPTKRILVGVFVVLVGGGTIAWALTGSVAWLMPTFYVICFTLFFVAIASPDEVPWLPAWGWLHHGTMVVSGVAGGMGMLMLGSFSTPPPGWTPGSQVISVVAVVLVLMVIAQFVMEPIRRRLPSTPSGDGGTSAADIVHWIQYFIFYLGGMFGGMSVATAVLRLYVTLPDPGPYLGP